MRICIDGLQHPVSGATLIGSATAPMMNVPTAVNYRAEPHDASYDAIPYWLINSTPDSASANLQIASMRMSVSTSTKFGGEEIVETAHVHVPILTNPKAIQPGAELLVFKPTKRPHGDSDIPLSKSQPAPNAQKTGLGLGKGKGQGNHCFVLEAASASMTVAAP